MVQITIYDLTGYLAGTSPMPTTPIGTGYTDSFGNFSIQLNPNAFSSAGIKTLGVQATDASGTEGNIAEFEFLLEQVVIPPGPSGPDRADDRHEPGRRRARTGRSSPTSPTRTSSA